MIRPTHACVIALFAATLLTLAACGQSIETSLATAKAELAAKKYVEAAIVLKSALQTSPQSAEIRLLLGQTLYASRNYTNANVELRKALELGRPAADVVPLLARSLLTLGKAQALVDEFGKTMLDNPAAQADLKTSVAAAYASLKQPAESGAAIAEALKAVPANPDTLLLQARFAAEQRQFDQAGALIEQAIAARPTNPQAWQQKGDLLLVAKGDATGAIEAYHNALSHDPDHVGTLSNLIAALILKQDVKGAKEQLKALQTALPNNPQTTVFEANLALLDNQPQRAKELIDLVLQVAPDNLQVLQLAAAIEIRNGLLLRAERTLGKLLALAPGLRMERNQLAEMLVGQGRPAKALATLQPLLASGSADSQTHALAGLAQLQEGHLDQAADSFSTAVRLNPSNKAAQTHLALAQLKSAGPAATAAKLQHIAAVDQGQVADLALVSLHTRNKDFGAALRAVDALQAKEKDNPSTAMLRGRIHLLNKDKTAARTSFERALAIDPSFVEAASILAGMDLDDKQAASAKKRFQDVQAADPRNVQAVLGLAKIMALEGAPRADIADKLQQAVKLDPGSAEARLALVNHHLGSRSVEAAQSAAQEAIAALPENTDLLDVLGRAQMLAGDNNQAISTFKRLAALEPHSPRGYLRMSGAFLASNNKRAAEQNLRQALTITPNLLEAQRALARMALADKRPQDALRIAKTVQSQRPRETAGYFMEADIEHNRKNLDGELAVYRRALGQMPSTEMATRLYIKLSGAKRQAEADKFAASWLAEYPLDAEFQAVLGDLAMAMGKYDLAERQYSAVLKLRPENALAMNNMAWILNKQGKPAAALAMAEQAVKLYPKAPGLMDTLALVLAANDQLPRAVQVQKAALALDPNTPELRLNLARLLIKSGDKATARTELKQLEALGARYPAQDEVRRLLAAL